MRRPFTYFEAICPQLVISFAVAMHKAMSLCQQLQLCWMNRMIWWCLKADSVIEVLSFRPWVWFHRSAEMVCWKSGQVMPALNEVSLIEFHSKHDFQDSVTFWCTQARHFWRVPSVHRGRICFYQDRNLYYVLSTGSPWAWWQDPDCPEQGWHGGPPGWKFTPGFIQLFLFYISSGIDAGIWSSDVELGQGISTSVIVGIDWREET